MEVSIKIGGQAVSVEITVEVCKCLDRSEHKSENLAHEQRRHWDRREFDEYIVARESRCYAALSLLLSGGFAHANY